MNRNKNIKMKLFKNLIVALLIGSVMSCNNQKTNSDSFSYDAGPDIIFCYGYNDEYNFNDSANPKGEWNFEKLDINISDGQVKISEIPPGKHILKYSTEHKGKLYTDILTLEVVNPPFNELRNDTLTVSIEELKSEIKEGRFTLIGLDFFDEDLREGQYQKLKFEVTDIEGCQEEIERTVYILEKEKV